MKVKDFPKFGKESAPIVGMFAFILNFILTRALIPGRIENLVALIDLQDVGLTTAPKKFMKEIGRQLRDYFKGRLYRLYFINAEWSVKLMWTLAK